MGLTSSEFSVQPLASLIERQQCLQRLVIHRPCLLSPTSAILSPGGGERLKSIAFGYIELPIRGSDALASCIALGALPLLECLHLRNARGPLSSILRTGPMPFGKGALCINGLKKLFEQCYPCRASHQVTNSDMEALAEALQLRQ